ncbi:DeoR/GlpR family DNA-binding transcription regulator [Pseudarthrobacter sp. NPDC092439]|uniref:DeoR/GlpR family DNA-binding transcription regulator n=1 Tax=unclassified Pseudarthrobacter TaxID=2647000 RepID=UPI0037FE37F7
MVLEIPALRLERLKELITDGGALSVRTAMSVLDVSEMTVRRDFAALEDQGLVQRTRGGVVATGRIAADVSYSQREQHEAAAKMDIGVKALGLVKDGDILFISGGTTCLAFARALRGRRRVTVITNAVTVLTYLMTDPGMTVLATGGVVSAQDQDMTGPVAAAALARFRVNKAFIGASGVSAEGVFNSNQARAATDELMVKAARHAYVLADRTKLEAVALALVAGLESIDGLVTDSIPADATLEWLDDAGVQTLIAGGEGATPSEGTNP